VWDVNDQTSGITVIGKQTETDLNNKGPIMRTIFAFVLLILVAGTVSGCVVEPGGWGWHHHHDGY
jgi:hypothetical protein